MVSTTTFIFATLALSTITMGAPAAAESSTKPLKLATRSSILRRTMDLEARRVAGRNNLAPRASTKSYPTCTGALQTGQGYAMYTNWDFLGDDLEEYNSVTSLSDCMTLCTNYGSECSGAFYWGEEEECFLKAYNDDNGGAPDESTDNNTDEASQDSGSVAVLKGTCAQYSPYVVSEMDAVCCNNYAA